MKRKILMAGTAMLIAAAAIAGNSTKTQSCCSGSKCEKTCSKKCDCGKNCSPDKCKSKDCTCRK
jgi:hypothetical protein